MFIALTGLHAAGKSFIANSIMSKYGFNIYSKKDIICYACKSLTGKDNWREWYKDEFNRDPYNITKIIISYLNLEEDIVLDAVHSDLEWGIIKSLIPNAELISIVTPDYIRSKRREEGDLEKDKKRIGYWHNGGGCLLSESSWALNGGASIEMNEKLFVEFLEYIHNRQLSIQGEDVSFSDSRTEKLESLISIDRTLGKKIEQANEILAELKKNHKAILEEQTRE